MLRRLTAEGSWSLRVVSESCHHSPSDRSAATLGLDRLAELLLIERTSAGLAAGS